MTFEEFWKQNKDRYLKIAESNVKLAINCAAEDAWGAANSNTVELTSNFNGILTGKDAEEFDRKIKEGLKRPATITPTPNLDKANEAIETILGMVREALR